MIEFELQRIQGRKTLAVYIGHDGKVVVRSPYGMDIEHINKFIASKSDWIAKKLRAASEEMSFVPDIKNDENIVISGETYKIKRTENSRCSVVGDILYLPYENCETAFKNYIKKAFLPYISQRTSLFAKNCGLTYKQVKIGTAAKRWGSCTCDNVINYSISVALLPLNLIDYIIMHELCHTKEKNHGNGFYFLLEKFMPDYKKRQILLKKYSALCGFFSKKK